MATLASLASIDDVTNDTLAGGITEEEAPNGEDTTDKGAFITFRNVSFITKLTIHLFVFHCNLLQKKVYNSLSGFFLRNFGNSA